VWRLYWNNKIIFIISTKGSLKCRGRRSEEEVGVEGLLSHLGGLSGTYVTERLWTNGLVLVSMITT
jgi:hypothetical protein